MKKTLTLLSVVLITLISFKAKAQDVPEYVKSYISFLGGVSTPTSNFGQSNYYNNSAGFAKRGTTLQLDGAYYFYKNLGFGVTFSFQDQGEIDSLQAQSLANGYNTDFVKDRTDVTAVNRYQSISLMGGPQYSFKYKKFILDLRAQAGLLKSTSTPMISVVFDNSFNTAQTLNQLRSTSSAFAYGGLVGIRYSFSDSWDVGLRANYLNCSGIDIVNTNHTNNTGRLVTKQPISVIQTTVGMTVHF
jgi:opacity protein-like surface antigen